MMLSIRKADAGEAALIANIVTLARRAHYTSLFSPEDLATGEAVESVEEWQTRLDTGLFQERPELAYLALADNQPAAQAAFILGSPKYDKHTAEVSSFFGHPAFNRKGVGSYLFKHIINEARTRGQKKLVLCVLETNKVGRNFYARMNGTPNGDSDEISWCGRLYKRLYYQWNLQVPIRMHGASSLAGVE